MHVFSVDVEDWYQSSFDFEAPVSEICVANTRHVLSVLDRLNVKGTFFVQGLVAKEFPYLIAEIKEKGHEIQAHGYSHRPINRMTPSEFRRELSDTIRRIEDITSQKVYGFRAPDFSIERESFWAFEVMSECGIIYDSSIFPLKTRRYGISGFERSGSTIRTPSGPIKELPVSVLELSRPKGLRIPVGGGGYFRLFPLWFLRYSLKRLEREGLPFVLYCHPYEFNPSEWRQLRNKIPLRRRIHQGLGRGGFEYKVMQLLKIGAFGTMSELLQQSGQKRRG